MKILVDNGYKKCSGDYNGATLWQKRVDSERVCETNERLFINVWEYSEFTHSFEVEITAEYKAKWWVLKVYSLGEEQLTNELQDIEQTLIKLFNAI